MNEPRTESKKMPENEASDWERQSALVLQSLQDFRLSADAALKGINELKLEFVRVEERLKKTESENQEIKARLDRANQWLMGILAAIVIYGLQQVITLVQAMPKG